MSTLHKDHRDVLLAPVVSEKSYSLLDTNKYTFVVRPDANKTEIKIAVEKIFNVKVTSVNTLNRPGKTRRTRNGLGKRKDTKRAIVSLAEAVLLLAVGVFIFGLTLPTTAFGWFTLTWVFLLGVVSCSLLGVLISNVASNAVSAAVLTNGPAVGLQFVSGTYVPIMVLPTWMLIVGSIFPVKWMAQGFRSVLLPPELVVFEPAGSWEHERIFLVLAAWSIGGLLGCRALFRWSDRS